MYGLKLWWHELPEKIWQKLAWWMPRRLTYWCAVRVMAHATGPGFEHSNPDHTSVMIALKRWP